MARILLVKSYYNILRLALIRLEWSDVLATERKGTKMLNTKLRAVVICIWYHAYEDGPTRGRNIWKPLMHEYDN